MVRDCKSQTAESIQQIEIYIKKRRYKSTINTAKLLKLAQIAGFNNLISMFAL